MLKSISSVFLALLLAFCTPSVPQTLATMPLAVPAAPTNDSETVLSLALQRAVMQENEVPDYRLLPDPTRIVLLKATSLISPRILPATDKVHFILLSPEEIHELAEGHGHFLYLGVGLLSLAGDSALVSIGTGWAPSRRNPGIVYLSGGSCNWIFRKLDGVWHFERSRGCLIS